MRALMGLTKNEHGTYHVHRKVPKNLEAAVALLAGRASRVWPGYSGHLEPRT